MLISEFAKAVGLTPDTVRFYVRRGLLDPQLGAKGGRNSYQLFTGDHVRTAELIRIGQALGLSLKEIGTLLADAQNGRLGPERTRALMLDHRDRLRRRAAEFRAMADYLDAKIAWMEAGSTEGQPRFTEYVPVRGEDATTSNALCRGRAA